MATATSAGRRRPGRPAQVTSEQIVAAAATIIRDDPDSQLTMAKVAAAVGVTPMALYRHFKDRDALLDGVVSVVLRERNAAIPRTGPWQDQLRAWIRGGFEHLVPYAQVVRLVMAGGSFRWMHDAATLARILEQAGFEGQELAETQLWIATSVGGFVMAYAERPERSPRVRDVRGTRAARRRRRASRRRAHPVVRAGLRQHARRVRPAHGRDRRGLRGPPPLNRLFRRR